MRNRARKMSGMGQVMMGRGQGLGRGRGMGRSQDAVAGGSRVAMPAEEAQHIEMTGPGMGRGHRRGRGRGGCRQLP
ncbi:MULTISPECIES: hypothetical protein [unclassified Ectothiorhodospira]|uniref:hypothetical protein n=1 Tax=unclassified Ectothiorhodospira TaxID=2684909 RepID=UPI001EE78752|nr:MULTISPECIES: hypothetical protein [unclassified Ectothiorhodospira]MCG5514720.1 hypothetical protein [Ectothiorhodospira sp. 9100]MCG5518319.1 hypothetical protein [Ectothiorhodospira sp. 9905]